MRHPKAVLGFVVLLHAAAVMSASAAPDTWVSGTGVDAGNCQVTAPCRSFQYALKYTKEGGIIAVQSSGSFAGVRINKPVTIAADGVVAIIRTKAKGCGAATCVDTDGAVTLRGLTIDPLGSGIDGIEVVQVGLFHLKESVIRQSKIGLLTNAPANAFWGKIEVSNSSITGNQIGIRVVANGETKVALDRIRVHNNRHGVVFDDSTGNGSIVATVTDSVIAGHTGRGIHAVTINPGTETPGGIVPNVSVTLDRTAVLDNNRGILVGGQAARVRIGTSTITGNDVALLSINNGVIPSYGTNKLDGNGSGETPTLVIPSQ